MLNTIKMNKNIILTCVAILFTSIVTLGQQTGNWCGAEKINQDLLNSSQEYKDSRDQLQKFTQTFTQNNPVSTSKQSGAPIYTIPVVFHIIHNYGYENIPKSRVEDEIEYLNKSFQNLWPDTTGINPPFKSTLADCQIEFKLAQIDPNGNCTDGITRTVSDYTYGQDNLVKGLISWPTDKYMNVWVVASISTPGVLAYANYPANPISSGNGIVIRSGYVGAPSTGYDSRVLTHEVGHWLNLPHTWGSNDPGLPTNCSDDDFVNDTPNTIGTFACDYNFTPCFGLLSMVENYMDYASCSLLFTNGQKARMHAALNSSVGGRSNLVSPANLIATGTNPNFTPVACQPIAEFNKAVKYLCTGATVNFQDLSWRGDPASWQWDFPGGTPSTSTAQNPTVQYNTPGVYDVTLTVTNAGGSNSITSTGMIIVSPAVGSHAIPFVQDFENITFPGTYDWSVENEAGNPWEHTTAAAYSGAKSVRIINHSGNPNGTTDIFVTEGYDFTNIINASMTFQLAFAVRSTASTDQLKVYASSDCGQTWALRYTKTGPALATGGLVNASFVPTSTQWRLESLSVNGANFNNKPNVKFKFEYFQNTGNNIYIDDINLTGTSNVGIADIEFLATVNVYPNPSSNSATTTFELSESNNVKIELLDISGRTIEMIANQVMNPGTHMYEISENLASGTYFIRYTVGANNITRKYIKL